MPGKNLRFELRAYEATDCCRLASFLLALASEPPEIVDRDGVVNEWAARYPRHAVKTGEGNVRSRVGKALSVLKVAGIAQPREERIIEVVNEERLRMAAGNLAIVEDSEGFAIRPGLWAERPAVPEHLLEVQEVLEQQRQQDLPEAE